jgi:hypothetical protein
MKGLENHAYLFGLIGFNVLSLFFLLAAVKWPRLSRLLFFLLFAWAGCTNWIVSHQHPAYYREYADLTFVPLYRDIINGWFSHHVPLLVGIIAICQGMIAVSMLLKGWIFKLGCIGGIIFLLSIAPFGVGSGFPCTIIFAIALVILFRKGEDYLWEQPNRGTEEQMNRRMQK